MAYVDKCFSAEQSCSAGKLGSLRGAFTAKHSCRTVIGYFGSGTAWTNLLLWRCLLPSLRRYSYNVTACVSCTELAVGVKSYDAGCSPAPPVCPQVGLQVILQPAVQNVLARTAWCVASHASPEWSHILYRPLNDLRSRSLAVGVAYPVYASARVLEQPVSSPERAEQLPHWLRRGSPAVPRECTATAVSAERLARGSVWAVNDAAVEEHWLSHRTGLCVVQVLVRACVCFGGGGGVCAALPGLPPRQAPVAAMAAVQALPGRSAPVPPAAAPCAAPAAAQY